MAIVCGISIVAMITSIIVVSHIEVSSSLPTFDLTAVDGTPDNPGESWSLIYRDGMEFSAHLCGEVILVDRKADIYFTNDEGNTVWMKLRIYDQAGNIIAETGLIKPGQYIKTIPFTDVPARGQKISMKIMTYQPDTYYSEGAVTITTTIG